MIEMDDHGMFFPSLRELGLSPKEENTEENKRGETDG